MSAPGDAYEIVPYHDRHRAEVLRLRTLFHSIAAQWNEAHFRWQQEQNPCFEGHLIRLASWRGEVVAMRALQPAEWEVGSPPTRFRAPCFAGTVIDPAHRRRGLFARLTRAVEGDLARLGIAYAFNPSAGPATYVASLAEGWREIGPLGRVLRESSFTGSRVRQRLRRNLVRVAGSLRRPPPGVQVSSEPRPEEMARLVRETRRDGRIRRVRDEAYFRWRFRDPSSRYRFLFVERDARLAGFVALQRPAPPIAAGELRIADWERAEGLSWHDLLEALVDYAERTQQDLVTWLASFPQPVRPLLRDCAFDDHLEPGPISRARPTVLVRKIGAGSESPTWSLDGLAVDDLKSWDLRMTDSDAF